MQTLYAITHINKHGQRTLTFANQGHNHYPTREIAQAELDAHLSRRDLENIIGHRVHTLEVRPVECYDNWDAVGIYFDNTPETPTAAVTLPEGKLAIIAHHQFEWGFNFLRSQGIPDGIAKDCSRLASGSLARALYDELKARGVTFTQ